MNVMKDAELLARYKIEENVLAAKLRQLCKKHGNKWKEINPKESAKVLYHLALHYRKYSPDKFSLVRSAGLFNAAIVRNPDNVTEITKDLDKLCSHVLKLSNAHNQDADLRGIAENCKKMAKRMRVETKNALSKIHKIPWISFNAETGIAHTQKRKYA